MFVEVTVEEIRNREFVGETVVLDGRQFIHCEFKDCELRYSGGPLIFDGIALQGCRWALGGPARRTIDLLGMFDALPGNLSMAEMPALPC